MTPDRVHETLRRHLLVDGFDLVLDTHASRGSWLVDARDGARHLDLFSFFASAPLGMNHPALADDPDFVTELVEVAVNKPSNSDIYTTYLAEFVETFARVLGDPALPHLFFVEGGALGRRERAEDRVRLEDPQERDARASASAARRCCTCAKAFHGRSGYTLSLTNTDPGKTDSTSRSSTGRASTCPPIRFPIDDRTPSSRREQRGARAGRGSVRRRTRTTSPASSSSRSRARAATTTSAPSSSSADAGSCADENDVLLVFDEVQTGVRHDRHDVGLPAARRRARRRRVRQEDAGLRLHGGRARRRGRPTTSSACPAAHQLDVGRQPHRHGPLAALPRGDRRGGPGRPGRRARQAAARRPARRARHRQRPRAGPVRRVRPADARGPRGGAAAPARGPRARARRRRALDPAASGVDHRGGRPGPGRPRDREGGESGVERGFLHRRHLARPTRRAGG